MALLVISILGILALLMMIPFVFSISYRVLPSDTKKAFRRLVVSNSMERILNDAQRHGCEALVMADAYRTLPEDVIGALHGYVKDCVDCRSIDACKKTNLGEGYYVAAVRSVKKGQAMYLTFDVEGPRGRICVKPSMFGVKHNVHL